VNEFNVYGEIISDNDQAFFDWIGWQGTSPSKLIKFLQSTADPVIRVNSTGGDLTSGATMFTRIKEHGNVTAIVDGIAASAASVLLMGAKTIKMSPAALLMIHNAWAGTEGDYREMASTADMLKTANAAMIAAYKMRTGMSEAELQSMMDADTYMSAEKALELGFIDEIVFDESNKPARAASIAKVYAKASGQDLTKLRQLFSESQQQAGASPDEEWQSRASAQIEIEAQRF